MTTCKLCLYPARADIERKIAARQLSMGDAARMVSCDKASIHRHFKNHVPAKVIQAAADEERREALDVVNRIIESLETTREILRDALADGDRRVALKALEVELKQLELNAKITGQFSEGPSVNFLMNPEFVKLKQVIVEKLMPFPDARLALSEALDELADEPELIDADDE